MTIFRLDTYSGRSLVQTDLVDGVERDDLAIKLLIVKSTARRCKLFADDILIAEMDRGTWFPSAQRYEWLRSPDEHLESLHAAAAA
jgi:hypothetical protein